MHSFQQHAHIEEIDVATRFGSEEVYSDPAVDLGLDALLDAAVRPRSLGNYSLLSASFFFTMMHPRHILNSILVRIWNRLQYVFIRLLTSYFSRNVFIIICLHVLFTLDFAADRLLLFPTDSHPND